MVCNVITADKANRLYWLGRYAERVYISLHLLRRYHDKVIDGDIANLSEYYSNLGVESTDESLDSELFQLSQLYSPVESCSILSSVVSANDNAIVLRREITSESLSYIQMSLSLINHCSVMGEKNITLLQPVTDYMLAFFGSIDERVFDPYVRNYLKIGHYVENIELHLRFHYPFFRIEEVFESLKGAFLKADAAIDSYSLEQLERLLTEENYTPDCPTYRASVLGYLGSLVLV